MAVAQRAQSSHIFDASRAIAFVWLFTTAAYFAPPHDNTDIWHFALVHMIGLYYFYREWSAPHGQHRQLHYSLMVNYFAMMVLYCYHIIADAFIPEPLQMTGWHFIFFTNRLFEIQLLSVIVYSVLRMYARADSDRWRQTSTAIIGAAEKWRGSGDNNDK
ncbi:MAG: hypothetical protein AAGJ87_09380 [Pseudomonadota bacterium]